MIALVCVDVQRDFLPGGHLAVPHGDEVIPVLQRLAKNVDVVLGTRDLHPPNHCSFVEQGGPWPAHCVEGTEGAELSPLIEDMCHHVFSKGRNPNVEEYSVFSNPDFEDYIFSDVEALIIGGLATDFCVKATVLDALREGYKVIVPEKACRAVNNREGKGALALFEMEDKGAIIV